MVKEGEYSVNTVSHVCKWTMRPVETIPGMRGGEIKENDGGGEFKYDVFDML
jgi:hypothetical protein